MMAAVLLDDGGSTFRHGGSTFRIGCHTFKMTAAELLELAALLSMALASTLLFEILSP